MSVVLEIENLQISEELPIDGEVTGSLDLTGGKEIYKERIGIIDDELSLSSENPVQNKVIAEALDDKVDMVQQGNTVLAADSSGELKAMALGNALQIDGQRIEVKTVNEMEDSQLPMSAAGVHVIVGNIDAILKTI